MKLKNAVLVSALATPLCKLSCKDEDVYVFYGDKDPQFTWDGTPAKVLHLSREDALSAARVTLKDHQEYLVSVSYTHLKQKPARLNMARISFHLIL